MRTIEKKIWPKPFNMIVQGKKRSEVRLADFKASTGDNFLLREWNPRAKKYTGRELKFKVGSIVKVKNMEKYYSKEDIKKYGFLVIELK
jgi:ASC-1-like (ASCH) protein